MSFLGLRKGLTAGHMRILIVVITSVRVKRTGDSGSETALTLAQVLVELWAKN
jgi:hypothetical protein